MRRLTFQLAIALLTFVIGIASASLWSVFRSLPENGPLVEGSPGVSPAKQRVTYRTVLQASGTGGGYDTCQSLIESSDGMGLSIFRVYFDTPKRADRELQKKLREAVEVVNRKPILDENGRQVGEQVIATFPRPNGASALDAELIWTRGKDFVSVSSSSLESILKYEKSLKH